MHVCVLGGAFSQVLGCIQGREDDRDRRWRREEKWTEAAPGTCPKVNAVCEVYAFLLGRAGFHPAASPSLPSGSRRRKYRQGNEWASDTGRDARTLCKCVHTRAREHTHIHEHMHML